MFRLAVAMIDLLPVIGLPSVIFDRDFVDKAFDQFERADVARTRAHGGAGGRREGGGELGESFAALLERQTRRSLLFSAVFLFRERAASLESLESLASLLRGRRRRRRRRVVEPRGSVSRAARARDVHAETTTNPLRFAGPFDVVVR